MPTLKNHLPLKWHIPLYIMAPPSPRAAAPQEPSNVYQVILSHWLDVDYLNLSFSGGQKGKGMTNMFSALRRVPLSWTTTKWKSQRQNEFVDGEALFSTRGRNSCTRDSVVHPMIWGLCSWLRFYTLS